MPDDPIIEDPVPDFPGDDVAEAESARADPLLDDLTPPQREAAMHVDGPLLVLAGAGSGKTRVITRRIAHLVKRVGIAPWSVLAITFTNKAAGEMRQRIAQLMTEKQARALTVCTFHSLGVRILSQYGHHLGLPSAFSIYDSADQARAMKTALEALEISTSNFPPAKVLQTISAAKNDMVDAPAFAVSASDFYTKTVARVYLKYQEILQNNHALDFDDLLFMVAKLFRGHPEALAQLQDRYQYILIDEYQDTNHVQFVVAHALAARHQNICATGDPDQAIYGWRGANIRNILDFETQFPHAKVVRLEQNYRSTANILLAADALIRNNRHRKHKSLWTENESGDPVRIVTCDDEREEARYIVQTFQELHDKENLPWNSMAIFYRINSLSRVIEEEFRRAVVPYQIARGTAFYDRKEIKDAIAYLRVIGNPSDEVNLQRILNTPARGISDATAKVLQAHAVARHTSLYEALHNAAMSTGLNSRALSAVTRFAKALETWRAEAGLSESPAGAGLLMGDSLRGFVERVLRESGIEEHYRNDKTDTDGERLANLGELISSVQQYEDEIALEDGPPPTLAQKLQGYLTQVSLVADVDSVSAEQGAVTLMTLHAAKGLEFPVVAILALEDGLLPHQRARGNEQEMEEERRLCFVGITRARRRLFMTRARQRTVFGQRMPTIESQFMRELPPESVEILDERAPDPWQADEGRFSGLGEQRQQAKNLASQFPPGQMVRHAQFGLGRVLTITTAGAQTRAQVAFNTAGVRTMVLQYANLERVNR